MSKRLCKIRAAVLSVTWAVGAACLGLPGAAWAGHGYALWGQLKYPAQFLDL